jgi:hypothetical protein
MMSGSDGTAAPRADTTGVGKLHRLRYTRPTVPIAVIVDFDPYAQLFGDLAVRWGAGMAAVIVAALLSAGSWRVPAVTSR